MKKKIEIEKKVIIDNRENKSGIPAIFEQEGWDITYFNLPSGDYVYKKIVVERKSPEDYLQSLYNNRLFKEIKQMVEDPNNYEYIYIVIQGDFYNLLQIARPDRIKTIQASLISCMRRGATPLFTGSTDPYAFYTFLTLLFEKHYDGKDRTPHSFTLRKVHNPNEYEITKNVLFGYPNVGDELAERIMNHFGTLKAFHNATVDDLMKVEGIGKKKAQQLHRLINFNWHQPITFDDILEDDSNDTE